MTRTENRRSHTDHRASLGDGVGIIVAHAHRQAFHSYIIVCFSLYVNKKLTHLSKKYPIIARMLAHGRDRHESAQLYAGIVSHFCRKLGGFVCREARLALLPGDVDLQQDALHHAALLRQLVDGLQQLDAIDRFDEIHRTHEVLDLVRLQPPDKMQRLSCIRPLRQLLLKLLHAVFAAAVHVRGDRRAHRVRVVHFRRRAELNVLRRASGIPRRLRHRFPNVCNVFRDRLRVHYPTTFPSYKFFAPTRISSPGQRFSVFVLSSSTT